MLASLRAQAQTLYIGQLACRPLGTNILLPVQPLFVVQGPVPTKRQNIGTALKLFGLSSVEVVRGEHYDSKALIAAGGNTIVVAFRGTASKSAALADLQVGCLPA